MLGGWVTRLQTSSSGVPFQLAFSVGGECDNSTKPGLHGGGLALCEYNANHCTAHLLDF